MYDRFKFKGAANGYEIIQILKDIISIESINSDYPGATTGENRVGEYVFNYMKKIGLECYKQEVFPGRFNVVGRLPGRSSEGLCFNTHMDTMPVVNMTINPFEPIIKDGIMYGRGSCDAKGSLAAMLYAMKLLVDKNITPATDTYLVAVVDEESRGRGILHLIDSGFKVSGVVVGEPTELQVIIAGKGLARWFVHTKGLAAHTARPREGHNAIYDMADIIVKIKDNLIPEYNKRIHKLLGSPTVSVSCIAGGILVNIVPDKCTIEIDRRMLPGENWESVSKEFEFIFEEVKQKNPELEVFMEEPYNVVYAQETQDDHPLVKSALQSCREMIGPSEIGGAQFTSDANRLHNAGITSITLGPGNIIQAHSANEFINVEEVIKAAEIYAQISVDYLF